jgi:hypothetical protein
MCTWNNAEFFRLSARNALEICDELIIAEGCHSASWPQRSTDGTLDYIEDLRKHPRVTIAPDFTRGGSYDVIQAGVRGNNLRKSSLWEPGTWVFIVDDDVFIFEDQMSRIRQALAQQDHANLVFLNGRRFLFNFKIHTMETGTKGDIRFDRITEGCYIEPVCHMCYANGTRYRNQRDKVEVLTEIAYHHYPLVKLPERQAARWKYSFELGSDYVAQNKDLYDLYMNVDISSDDAIRKNASIITKISGGQEGLGIWNGKHPNFAEVHPWRHIDDVRLLS